MCLAAYPAQLAVGNSPAKDLGLWHSVAFVSTAACRMQFVSLLSQLTCRLFLSLTFPCVLCRYPCACTGIDYFFCLFFSVKFNMKSALFVCQLPTLPQIIDSREGLFRCKKGVVLGCGRMNIYYNKPSFAPTFEPFLAKYGAICR